jgi:hypothetical protein
MGTPARVKARDLAVGSVLALAIGAFAPPVTAHPDDIVARVRVIDRPPQTPPCGRVAFQSVGHYEVLAVERGAFSGREIYLVHMCGGPAIPPATEYRVTVRRGLRYSNWRAVYGLTEAVRHAGYFHIVRAERVAP